MRKAIKGVAVVAVVAVGALWAFASVQPSASVNPAFTTRQGDAVHGAYLARVGDCVACHTAKGGAPFAGGLPFDTPVGRIYSTNITPDQQNGIGGYTFEQFALAVREGVRKDGARLYPAMPFTSYAKVSDADLLDLYAYFTSKVPASAQANRASDIVWPLSVRWPLAYWSRVFHDDTRYVADTSKSVEWNRGAYLVQGLAHCGACHTPRGAGFEEKDLSGKTDVYLSGSSLDGTAPINLRSAATGGLVSWSNEDIVASLKTGRNPHSSVSGPMGEVVENSTQYLSDADLASIAVYLKSLGAADQPASFHADDSTVKAILAGQATGRGASIYIDSCSACHRVNGQGATRVFPSLVNNPMATQANPDSLLAVILGGARLPSTESAPSPLAMPGFGWRYDDEDVAQLATFIRSSWGNQGAVVTADQVAKVRAKIAAN
ncbi:Cytochrome c, mono-and diheme variants [Paraburkholderia fungorum]|uniref:Cytochrome c, mono-and diheme variants n=1 Tax=Paraburkholderia fungorum TaxID=134537 RepID=A0A1H1HLA7_9BURK|nr:cytochrome c [Paraburkholderia fungorum]SDR26204.1 Cytochrome c, mono-and diheme variants [Paraburkholderia fungorum]